MPKMGVLEIEMDNECGSHCSVWNDYTSHCKYCHGEPLNDSVELCRFCGTNFQGDPIPEDDQHSFGATHFSRKMGRYDIGTDRTTSMHCPDCGGSWPCYH